MINISMKIKIKLLKKRITGAEIARQMGVTRAAIYHVISGRSRSIKLRKAICNATGLPMSIWDELDKELKKKAA